MKNLGKENKIFIYLILWTHSTGTEVVYDKNELRPTAPGASNASRKRSKRPYF